MEQTPTISETVTTLLTTFRPPHRESISLGSCIVTIMLIYPVRTMIWSSTLARPANTSGGRQEEQLLHQELLFVVRCVSLQALPPVSVNFALWISNSQT
jgi:hypothetical protein